MDTEKFDENLYKIVLPDLDGPNGVDFYDYETAVVDYESLMHLNSAVNQARLGLFRVTEKINEYERLETSAKLQYERKLRRAYLASTERTETAKKARSELLCEELENTFIAHQQIKGGLIRMSNAIRLELQTLQAVGNNIRQQMKV